MRATSNITISKLTLSIPNLASLLALMLTPLLLLFWLFFLKTCENPKKNQWVDCQSNMPLSTGSILLNFYFYQNKGQHRCFIFCRCLYFSKPHSYSCSYNKHTYVVPCLQSAVKSQQPREEGRSDDITDSDYDRETYSSSTDEDEINAIY